MPLNLRWVADDELDRVAETRMYCYAPATTYLERFKQKIRADRRAEVGDFLLAEHDGTAVGTATSLSMKMWVRGACLPCQGVAYVGTIKTHRRVGSGEQRGVASQIMHETLRRAREREQVVSALMPFRASYYEHFGYGVVETRHEWTVPLSILPHGDFAGFGFYEAQRDREPLHACRQRMVQAGQCDIERPMPAWEHYLSTTESYLAVDRRGDGSIRGWIEFSEARLDNRIFLRVQDQGSDSHESFMRQLCFLSSLRDQFSGAILTLPRDIPLNLLLRESQLPHRPVEHAVAKLNPYTRMQVRILDHKRFFESLSLPHHVRGGACVAVRECEGTVSRFRLDLEAGKARVTPTDASPDVECADKTFAAIACGEITATRAAQIGLVSVANPDAARVLDALSAGPAPFCSEYF